MTLLTTVVGVLVLCAIVFTVLSINGKCPLWIAVIFLCIVQLVLILPLK